MLLEIFIVQIQQLLLDLKFFILSKNVLVFFVYLLSFLYLKLIDMSKVDKSTVELLSAYKFIYLQ